MSYERKVRRMKIVQKTSEFYDQEASKYDALRWKSEAGAYTNAVQKAIVGQLLGDIQGQELLEIGSGTGRFTTHLIEGGANVTGLDVSLTMLLSARRLLANADCILIKGDAASLPFEAESFDGCLSVNAFSHMVNYKSALKEIARVLRPGGFLVVNFPNLLSYYLPAGVLVNVRGRALKRDVYSHWYTLWSFRLACAQAKLPLKQVIGQVHLTNGIMKIGLKTVLKRLDQVSRNSILRYLSPTLFIKAIKSD